MTLDEIEKRIRQLSADVDVLKTELMYRKCLEYPSGHSEEPDALKKFREQNPNWRDYQD